MLLEKGKNERKKFSGNADLHGNVEIGGGKKRESECAEMSNFTEQSVKYVPSLFPFITYFLFCEFFTIYSWKLRGHTFSSCADELRISFTISART